MHVIYVCIVYYLILHNYHYNVNDNDNDNDNYNDNDGDNIVTIFSMQLCVVSSRHNLYDFYAQLLLLLLLLLLLVIYCFLFFVNTIYDKLLIFYTKVYI